MGLGPAREEGIHAKRAGLRAMHASARSVVSSTRSKGLREGHVESVVHGEVITERERRN
jgi:hypothetical protein